MPDIDLLISYAREVTHLWRDNLDCIIALAHDIDYITKTSTNRSSYPFNIIDIIGGVSEPSISALLKWILNYDAAIVKSFICNFFTDYRLSVTRPKVYAEKDHIDILVEDSQYAIIIENKAKGAGYQKNQIARYIATLQERGFKYSQIFLVILPPYKSENYIRDLPASVWRLPSDWKTSNYDRNCDCRCDSMPSSICANCNGALFDKFKERTIVLASEICLWLDSLQPLISERDTLLSSGITQLSDYLNGIYKTRYNHNLLMELKSYIKSKLTDPESSALENWEKLNEYYEQLSQLVDLIPKVQKDYSKELIDSWYEILRPDWPSLQREYHKSLYIKISDMWMGCWIGVGPQPYWGIWTQNPATDEQKNMASEIVKKAGLTSTTPSATYPQWNYTLHGDIRCAALFRAAKELGFIK